MNLSEQEIAKIRIVLKRISFLEFLKVSEMDILISAIEKLTFKKGDVIIKQGTKGDTFYIMGIGAVGVFRDRFLSRKRIATLGPESFFGEMALIDDSPRNATIIADQDGEAYSLSRSAFNQVLMKNPWIADVIKATASYRKAQNKTFEAQ